MTITMDNPVGVLMNELADKRITQKSVSLTYMFIMRQEPNADWTAINAAIAKRWSKSGLVRVKEMAWKSMEGAA